MAYISNFRLILLFLIAIGLFMIGPMRSAAHESRDAGDFSYIVGWQIEPAYEGVPNAVSIKVSGPLETTGGALQVDLTHVPTGTTRTVTLEAAFDDPGHYIAPIIPTAPGAYRFHLTGEIRGIKVDQSFDSGPGTFDDIQTQTSIQFPLEVSAPREIEGAVRAAEDAAAVSEELASAASADASSAQTLAIGALVVGIIGLVFGIGGMTVGFRKN